MCACSAVGCKKWEQVLYVIRFQFSISKEEIANLCAVCERYIGTLSGGMDQAIAFLATEGEQQPLTYLFTIVPADELFIESKMQIAFCNHSMQSCGNILILVYVTLSNILRFKLFLIFATMDGISNTPKAPN